MENGTEWAAGAFLWGLTDAHTDAINIIIISPPFCSFDGLLDTPPLLLYFTTDFLILLFTFRYFHSLLPNQIIYIYSYVAAIFSSYRISSTSERDHKQPFFIIKKVLTHIDRFFMNRSIYTYKPLSMLQTKTK